MARAISSDALTAAIEAVVVRDYLRRGRQYAALSDEAAKRAWIEAFRCWVGTRDRLTSDAENDARAELLIRGLRLPEGEVAAELLMIAAEVARLGPLQDTADDDAMAAEIDELLRELDRKQ
jgi:hypothetical protein